MSDPVLTDNGMYKIDFSMGEGESLYQDALYFTPEVYATITSEEIQALKDQRYANWQAIVASIAQTDPVVSE